MTRAKRGSKVEPEQNGAAKPSSGSRFGRVPGTDIQIGDPEAPSWWQWLDSLTEDEWKRSICYWYRSGPVTDRQAQGKPISLEKWGGKFDQADVVNRHGSGRYRFDFCYIAPGSQKYVRVAQEFETVTLERIPAAADSDTATKQTVGTMCNYIAQSASDPVVKDAAEYVRRTYAGGGSTPALLAWGVFWFAKHNCEFVVDEAPLMRFERIAPGAGLGQQDMLISPAVLLRMAPWDRKGDCDDFTMLCCALLKALGVPFVIVTIAADPSDPSRWSHVFPMALCPNAIALDASHGTGPGWMVPAAHTFRWQCWDGNGNAVNVPRPQSGLHGWVRTGLGQDVLSDYIDAADTGTLDSSVLDSTGQVSETPFPIVVNSPTTASSSSGFNWTSFLNNLTGQAAGVAKVAELTSAGQTTALGVSNMFSSILPVIVVVVVGGIALNAFSKK